jgi:glucosyl-3-phosphoglycerate synthase
VSGVRTFALAPGFESAALAAKASLGTRVSVCIPCRNEAATVGSIVNQIVCTLTEPGAVFVDELLVLDDGSTDATAAVAAAAGASVVRVSDVLPEAGPGSGKGNVLWASVAASTGDVVVWCDGDLLSFTPDYIRRLVAPFLLDPTVKFVKAFYERLLDANGEGGGRNTELVARPLMALLFPSLAELQQPLAGEYAARREVLERVPFAQGYGVEVGLLIDVARLAGAESMVQVDLGVRRHRHRPLRELSPQAGEIMHAILRRTTLMLPASFDLQVSGRGPVPLRVHERPPLIDVPGYRPRP